KDIPREELIQKIEGTIEVVTQTLDRLPAEALAQEYPLLVLKEKTSTGYFLTHLAVHLGYHLGQINYHRRILEGA
ncbi:MAG TPA: DinB superfamily protein, partial [Chitinophagaceae bacterium]|nr:DinB superfamily protein [Chitinophagaceae bacterium]